MLKIKSIIGVAALLATITFTGCAAFQSAETTVVNWLKSPAVQAEIQTIEQAALAFATQYLAGLIAVSKEGAVTPLTIDTPAVQAQEALAVAALSKQFPDAPKAALAVLVNQQFKVALAAKYGPK